MKKNELEVFEPVYSWLWGKPLYLLVTIRPNTPVPLSELSAVKNCGTSMPAISATATNCGEHLYLLSWPVCIPIPKHHPMPHT